MDERVLITGINGFAGSHLADYIIEHYPKTKIFGTIRHQHRSNTENIEHIRNKITLFECNLTDAHNVCETIKKVKPHKIFHLAAQSHVHTSWTSPSDTYSTNILGQCNIFEALRDYASDTKILIACSSEEYGTVYPYEIPILETNPLRPLSPYAVSKVAQDLMAYQNFKSYGLHVVRTRAFNHSGPRRPHYFVDSSFARQIVEIEMGKKANYVLVFSMGGHITTIFFVWMSSSSKITN